MKLLCAFALLFIATATNGGIILQKLGGRHLPSFWLRHDLLSYQREVTANMNDYVDKLLKNAKEFMIENGLDPAQLEDIHQSFSATDLIGIVWHGELDLTKGWAQDLSTIYRSGDVIMEYDKEIMNITANIGFTDLTFNYDFSAKIMNIGPTGNVDGKANQAQVMMKVTVDLNTNKVSLQDFGITHVGDIKLEFTGMGNVVDWIADQLTKIILDLFKGPILDKVQTVIRGAIEDALANIDIGDFLPPPLALMKHLH